MDINYIFSEIGIDLEDIRYESNSKYMKELGIDNLIKQNVQKFKRYILLMYDNKKLIGCIYCHESYKLPKCPGIKGILEKIIYINNVDIIEEYQGKKLCSKMLDYIIRIFSEKGKNVLYIDNQSKTNDGMPACFCYTKPGINNGYIIISTNSDDQIKMRGLTTDTIPQKYETIESLTPLCITNNEGKTYLYFKSEYYYSDEMSHFREQIENTEIPDKKTLEELQGMKKSDLSNFAIKIGVSEESIWKTREESDNLKEDFIKLIIEQQTNIYGSKKFKNKKGKSKKELKLNKKIKSKKLKKIKSKNKKN